MRPAAGGTPSPGSKAAAAGAPLALRGERAEAMASKYVWWQPPSRTLEEPALLAAQLMTLGTLEDVQWLLGGASRDALRGVLREPPIGIFNVRSWRFWHLQLGVGPIPPLPKRSLPP